MKILVAPLNWGLGHASRCVPLVQRFLNEGHEVILGGDGDSLTLLRKHFPKLRYVYLAPLNLRYGKGQRQVWAMMKAIPQLIVWAIKDHAMLAAVLREEKIDRVVSDNRFGLYNRGTECIYMTHQLHIMLPQGWRWAESIAERLHTRIYSRYNKVWVPDIEEEQTSLSGALGHLPKPSNKIEYIGALSRFSDTQNLVLPSCRSRNDLDAFSVVAVLSGLEPQRTMLEREIIKRYAGKKDQVLVVQGLMSRPNTKMKRGNITIVPYLADEELAAVMLGAKKIIARSGYSTLMDLKALNVLDKAELIPTPGQLEQEYLASRYFS